MMVPAADSMDSKLWGPKEVAPVSAFAAYCSRAMGAPPSGGSLISSPLALARLPSSGQGDVISTPSRLTIRPLQVDRVIGTNRCREVTDRGQLVMDALDNF